MEALRRRREQLAREVDLRRQAAGQPSALDLRPDGGPAVDRLLGDFHSLLSIDGWAARAEIPYERLSHYLDRTQQPEIVRRIMMRLLHARNAYVAELREER